MNNPIKQRLRRNRKTRAKISKLKVARLSVHRTNLHIYAQIVDADGSKIIASASTLEKRVKKDLSYGGNINAASYIGKRIAEKAKELNIVDVAFDRSGNRYHGRVKALANAARENGLKF